MVTQDKFTGVICRLLPFLGQGSYKDTRKKVRYIAKLYINIVSGLRFNMDVGVRTKNCHDIVSVRVGAEELVKEESLRVSAAIQVIDI